MKTIWELGELIFVIQISVVKKVEISSKIEYMFKLLNSLISWCSKKQTIVALSLWGWVQYSKVKHRKSILLPMSLLNTTDTCKTKLWIWTLHYIRFFIFYNSIPSLYPCFLTSPLHFTLHTSQSHIFYCHKFPSLS